MHDNIDAPAAAPSDFPTDPVIHSDLLAWSLLTVCLVILACVLTIVFKEGEKHMARNLGDTIDKKVRYVLKFIWRGAQARQDDQIRQTEETVTHIRKSFGATLSLSEDLSKIVGKLNTALEGMREEEVKPKPATHGNAMSGGTVINIAVNQGGVVAGEPVAAGATPHTESAGEVKPELDKTLTPDEQSEAIWKSIQRLFSYWKNLNVVTAALRSAQQQLMFSPPFEWPREELRFDPSGRKLP